VTRRYVYVLVAAGRRKSMHLGLVMECDYREGITQEEAFDEAFTQVEIAETGGLDGVWLAERHFAAPGRPLDAFGTGIPSIASAPLILASAIAARTRRVRIGIAVSVLPLSHPIRMAEEAATVDQISKGRLDFGVGRSGFPVAYAGYAIPYEESRGRFRECLDVIRKAWTEERFSYAGTYYTFNDVCVLPKPYQKPTPPIRIAATTRETFPQVGRTGSPIFVGLRGFDVQQLGDQLDAYRQARQAAGHPGEADVFLRIPVYVAETMTRAHDEPRESTMRSYQRLARQFARTVGAAGTSASEDRLERAASLSQVSYEDLLRDRLAYGTPEVVAERLTGLREHLGLAGVVIEPNVGGGIPQELVLRSLRLFAAEVAPRLRSVDVPEKEVRR
jgi:alkanesulfonate monooxygenase SsuD/methylene tetrahydromethanopterin reductase-like flavin-dependent oxidoreductase (luciferase family)